MNLFFLLNIGHAIPGQGSLKVLEFKKKIW